MLERIDGLLENIRLTGRTRCYQRSVLIIYKRQCIFDSILHLVFSTPLTLTHLKMARAKTEEEKAQSAAQKAQERAIEKATMYLALDLLPADLQIKINWKGIKGSTTQAWTQGEPL